MPFRKKKKREEDSENEDEEKEKKKRAKPSHLFTMTLHAMVIFGNIKYSVHSKFVHNANILPLQQYLIGMESGFKHRKKLSEALEDVANGIPYVKSPFHCHVFMRTQEPFLLPDLRELLVNELDLPLADLEKCKSERSILKYITKEDWNPVIYNIDMDLLHTHFKIRYIVKNNPILSRLDYGMCSIPPCYQKMLLGMHSEYWSEINSTNDKIASSPLKNLSLLTVLKNIPEDTRGVIIYGETGKGKTSTVHNIISTPYYLFLTNSNFPMTNYNGERDILIDDTTVCSLLKHRELLLQLTGPYCAPCERKGGDIMKVPFNGCLYVTMNEDPHVLAPEWKRRFKIVHAAL